MNIAIFDLQHFEMVNVWHNIFADQKYNLHFFINKNVANKIIKSGLKNVPYTAVIEDDFTNIDNFFNACLTHTRNHNIDLVILSTVDTHYKSTWKFVKKLNVPVFMIVHNINTWLKPPFTLNKKALGYYYYRHKIISKTSGLIVLEELFIDYIKNNTNYKKPLFALPFTLLEKQTPIPKNDKLVIAIPGAIDGHRRDNDFSLSIIEKINAINKNIQFVFLGDFIGQKGQELFVKMQALQEKGCDVLHYFDKNSNTIFDEQMSRCDIVFLPLVVKTKYEGIEEIYGKTKATGVLYDLMRFQKPGIAPETLVIPPTIRNSIISYKNENDLIDFLLKLEGRRSIVTELINNAKSNSEYYTITKIRERFIEKFTSLITDLSISK